ncbi:hypothetical protein, partial [Arthrobacter humicola]|uniref:hypothetical protein n=1 Tax=Arthrobacter humicola TaxID=409291 RepID=UPI0031D32A7B
QQPKNVVDRKGQGVRSPATAALDPTAGRASGRPNALCVNPAAPARLAGGRGRTVHHGQAVTARSRPRTGADVPARATGSDSAVLLDAAE